MANILILYGTSEGHTATIAERIATVLQARGHAVKVVELTADSVGTIADYDAMIVASSIHAGQPHTKIRAFVQAHHEALHARPTAYVQVSLSTADPRPEQQTEAQGYADHFLQEVNWTPGRVALFGGALPFTRYGH